MDNNHYVYVYLDTRKPGLYQYKEFSFEYEPVYVGLGKGDRYKEHLKDCKNKKKSGLKLNKFRKIQKETGEDPKIIFIKKDLTLEESRILEKELINIIGFSYNETGPLTNLCEGGTVGPVGFKMNKEQRETRRLNCIGFWKNPEYRKSVSESNKKLWTNSDFREKELKRRKEFASTPEARKKNSEAQKIAQNRPEVKKRMCEIQKGNWSREEVKQKVRKTYECVFVKNKTSIITNNLMKFCLDNDLNYFGMQNCVTGFQKQHRGWTCQKVKELKNAN